MNGLQIFWLHFRHSGWVWFLMIVLSNGVMQPVLYWLPVHTGNVLIDTLILMAAAIILAVVVVCGIFKMLNNLPTVDIDWWLTDKEREERLAWISENCLFYYIHTNQREVWIPRASTRMAYKLRWE